MTKRIVRSNKRYDSIATAHSFTYKRDVEICRHPGRVDRDVPPVFRWCEECTDWTIGPVPFTEVNP